MDVAGLLTPSQLLIRLEVFFLFMSFSFKDLSVCNSFYTKVFGCFIVKRLQNALTMMAGENWLLELSKYSELSSLWVIKIPVAQTSTKFKV